jgi:hypothetical protein
VGSRIFNSPCLSDLLWGPPNLLSNGNGGALSPRVKRPGVKLTTHLQLMPRSRKRGSIHPLPHTPSWRSAYLVKYRDNFSFFRYPAEDIEMYCLSFVYHSLFFLSALTLTHVTLMLGYEPTRLAFQVERPGKLFFQRAM